MKTTPYTHRLEELRLGGYKVVVAVPCTVCDATGTRAIVRPHHETQYDNCPACHGTGCTDARREVYPFGDGVGMWFVLGWVNQRFASPEAAAVAIVESMRPAPVGEQPLRPIDDVMADLSVEGAVRW